VSAPQIHHRGRPDRLSVSGRSPAGGGEQALPVPGRRRAQREFLVLAGATIRSVAQGVIGIAVAQGLMIGIILQLADVPRAGLLAFAVMMLGILQVGSAIIVIPVLIWIWATKSLAVALIVTLCILPASLADNVLKPIVMGRGLTTGACHLPRRDRRRAGARYNEAFLVND
jgi:predicted PurR-regulated permease PerM